MNFEAFLKTKNSSFFNCGTSCNQFILQAISQTQQVEIYDEVESLTKEVKKLKDQRIDIIIAVGHSGYDTDLKIAKNVPKVDVVVGGHTNTFLYTGVFRKFFIIDLVIRQRNNLDARLQKKKRLMRV